MYGLILENNNSHKIRWHNRCGFTILQRPEAQLACRCAAKLAHASDVSTDSQQALCEVQHLVFIWQFSPRATMNMKEVLPRQTRYK